MTIQTSIQIRDGMTTAFRNMTTAMNLTLNTFESIQQASHNAIDTSSIQAAREYWAAAEVAVDDYANSLEAAKSSQQKFTRSVQDSSRAAGDLWNKVRGIAVAAGGIKAITGAVNLSDEMTQTKARLSMVVDDGGSVAALQQKIFESAQRSRADYLTTASMVAKLNMQASDAFSDNNEAIQFAENLNKQFTNAGATQEEMRAATLQLTQALGSGVLQGDELRSAFESAKGIVQNIADYLKVPTGSIRDMAADGQITAEIVKNAVLSATDSINEQFEIMPWTWGQVWTVMKNDALMAFEPIFQRINDLANSGELEQLRANMVGALTAVSNAAVEAFTVLGNIASFVYENWSVIAPAIIGVVTALLLYNSVSLITTGIIAAQALAKSAHAAATAMAAGATFAQTVAQYGLNAALYACPLTWIIVLVIALVAMFYAAIAVVNHFAETSYSATGLICGAFMTALAFIGNLFIDFYNFVLVPIIVGAWNILADLANFLGNVFIDPVGSIARLFFGLADSVLSVLESIASAIDSVFGSSLAASVNDWRNSLGSWVDETFGPGEEMMKKITGESLLVQRIDYGDAWDMGYNFGKGIEDTVGNIFNPADYIPKDMGNVIDPSIYANNGQYGGDTAANTGETAANTARMADSLEASEEELKLIREIAERQAIDKFTTAEVRVDMTGMTNKIEGGGDIDGFLSEFTVKLEDALYATAEGVHI